MTARRPGIGRVLLSGLVVALLLVASPVAAQPASERSVADRAAAYRAARARAGGFLLSPLAVTERLLARRATVVLDIRGRSRYRSAHLRGARSFPLSVALGGRIGRVRRGTPVVVVDDDGTAAIEAMVVLRLAGVRAYAMTGGMNRLRRLLADPDALPERSPVARRLPAARALIVGTAAGTPAAGGGAGRLLLPITLAVLVLLMGAGGLAFWSSGRAQHRRLAEAVSLIERDEPDALEQAVPLLEAALQGRLGSRERVEARFSLAYTLARLGAHRSASETLDQLDPARSSAAKVRALDPDLGDAHLLGGLVGWLFGEDGPDPDRNRAFEAPRTARALGVSVPEVLVLVGATAEDPASPAGRFWPLAEDDPDRPGDGPAPMTVAELESRGRLAWRRAATLRSRLSGDERLSGLWQEIDRLLGELEHALRRLGDGAADLIQLERQLAVRTSELRLLDDQEAAG